MLKAQTFTPSRVAHSGGAHRAIRIAKRWLFFVHRWLGVATCLLCAMWFLSGLVMLYVPFPSWSDEERVAALPPIATERVRVLPDDAMARSGVESFPATFRLEMFAGEPVYRIVAGEARVSLSATTGIIIGSVIPDDALRHLRVTFSGSRPSFVEKIDYDQWTVTRRFDPHRPLLKFALGDAPATVVYVSSKTGEIVQNSTRSERFWNWLGAVPHWIYFSPIRRNQELWRQAVMWLSGPLAIGAIAGLWIGLLRLRIRRRHGSHRITPYCGWAKWHHLGGLIGGVFLTTWIASGWLSVNPFQLFARAQLSDEQLAGYAGWTKDSAHGVTMEALVAAGAAAPSDISFAWVGGKSLVVTRSATGIALADPQGGTPVALEDSALIDAAAGVFPEAPITDIARIAEEEVHWYSHHTKRPLPVLKVRFDDSAATWLFLDPATGAIAGHSDASSRTYRWLFNFFHVYDLPALLRNQPARDILVWLLSAAGLVISVSGVVLGWRALTRSSTRKD